MFDLSAKRKLTTKNMFSSKRLFSFSVFVFYFLSFRLPLIVAMATAQQQQVQDQTKASLASVATKCMRFSVCEIKSENFHYFNDCSLTRKINWKLIVDLHFVWCVCSDFGRHSRISNFWHWDQLGRRHSPLRPGPGINCVIFGVQSCVLYLCRIRRLEK